MSNKWAMVDAPLLCQDYSEKPMPWSGP